MRTLPDSVVDGVSALWRGYLRIVTARSTARLSTPAPLRRTGFELELFVAAREQVADDVVALTLSSPTPLPHWTPGAHLDVVLPSGATRQYSLCGDVADRFRYRIAVRLVSDGGGGSRELHTSVHVGDVLLVRGPRQAFHLVPEHSYVFVAGGIGITPILPMLAAAERFGADWTLVYLGRSRATLPFLDELARYSERVVVCTDDEHGPPDVAALVAGADGADAVYMCAPAPLMDAVKAGLEGTSTRFHGERFSARPVKGGRAFTLRLARSGKDIEVGPDESALAALRREVPGVAYSCQQGFCGTCKLRVLEGQVEHQDQRLLPSERADHLLVCVSRAADGDLVLDL